MMTITFDEKTDLGKSLMTLIYAIEQTSKKLIITNPQDFVMPISAPVKKTTDFSKWFGIWKDEKNETFDRKQLWQNEKNTW